MKSCSSENFAKRGGAFRSKETIISHFVLMGLIRNWFSSFIYCLVAIISSDHSTAT